MRRNNPWFRSIRRCTSAIYHSKTRPMSPSYDTPSSHQDFQWIFSDESRRYIGIKVKSISRIIFNQNREDKIKNVVFASNNGKIWFRLTKWKCAKCCWFHFLTLSHHMIKKT